MVLITLLIGLSLAAPTDLPSQRLAIDDGGTLAAPSVRFGFLANTRPISPALDKRKVVHGSGTSAVVGDMTAQNMIKPLDFVVLLGDMVTASTPSNWSSFGDQFSGLIDGTTTPPSALRRVPVVPVVGDRDCVKNPSCEQFSKVFPGFGEKIGYGRVATWQSFDLAVGEKDTWRVVVVDSNKTGLGSRWREQMVWLKKAVADPGSGLIILMHESPVSRRKGAVSEGATELVDTIASHAPLLSVRAFISGGVPNNQVYLPEGALGPIHIIAGGGGAPTADLKRGTRGDKSEPVIDATFDDALDASILAYRGAKKPPSDKAFDHALGAGSFDGFDRTVSAGAFPAYGWWVMDLNPGEIRISWRVFTHDESFADAGSWVWGRESGWRAP
jgi:hypothetical protein